VTALETYTEFQVSCDPFYYELVSPSGIDLCQLSPLLKPSRSQACYLKFHCEFEWLKRKLRQLIVKGAVFPQGTFGLKRLSLDPDLNGLFAFIASNHNALKSYKGTILKAVFYIFIPTYTFLSIFTVLLAARRKHS